MAKPTAAQVQAVEKLVHETVASVDALAPGALSSLLPALKAARDELRKDLQAWLAQHPDGGEEFTAYQKKQALLAVESSLERIGELQPAMAQALGVGRKTIGGLAASNLGHEVQRLSSIFDGGMLTIPQIDTAAVIAQGNKLLWKRHEASAARYAGSLGDDIKVRLSVSLAKGDTFEQMVQRLRGSSAFREAVRVSDPAAAAHGVSDAMFHRWRHWADRLVRTENMHAYNVQHDLAIKHLNDTRHDDDDQYLRRWDATADKVTCPLCRELDRTLALIDGEFKGGIKSPPRHPYCRCVVLAWRADWGHFKGEVPAKARDGRDIKPAKDDAGAAVTNDVAAAQRRASASADAKKAAAEDIAAFDSHTSKKKAMDAQLAAAKAKQAKLLEEHKAKLAAAKAKAEADAAAALKAAEEAKAKAAAEAKAKLEAQRAAERAAKKAAEEAAQKQAKAAKAAAAKAKKTDKLLGSAAPFDPNTSGTLPYIPGGKAKGKAALLNKPGMVQVDANTIAGHGYVVKWSPADGVWVTEKGPHDLGVKFDYNAGKWVPKNVAPTPTVAPIAKKPLGPMPAAIKDHEWKDVGGEWVLHKNGIPTKQLVQPYQYGVSPKLADTYSLGGDLAKHGLVPTGAGVMEGHGYKFVKHADGNWYKTETLGQPYKNPSSPEAVAAKAQIKSAASAHPSGFKPMTEDSFRQATIADHKALTKEQRDGIVAYSGSSYTEINGSDTSNGLRNPPPSAEAKKHIAKMDKAFANPASRMKQDAVLFRGSGGRTFFEKFEAGGEFDDLGFVSTSMSTENGFYQSGQVRWHISVPKGHPAIAMGSELSHHSNEKEVLLPRGSRFRVLKKEEVEGRLYLHVEVLPNAP